MLNIKNSTCFQSSHLSVWAVWVQSRLQCRTHGFVHKFGLQEFINSNPRVYFVPMLSTWMNVRPTGTRAVCIKGCVNTVTDKWILFTLDDGYLLFTNTSVVFVAVSRRWTLYQMFWQDIRGIHQSTNLAQQLAELWCAPLDRTVFVVLL